MKALIQQTIERAEALRALTGGTPEDQAVAPLPTKLIVEATSNCNLACVYCPTSKIKDPMNMPLATYQKILGRLEEAGMAARISINGNGEPIGAGFTSTTVRQAPAWASDAPSAMPLGS